MSMMCLRRLSRCGRLFVATFAAVIILQVVHSRKYTSQELRQLQAQDYLVDEGPPFTCRFGTSTNQSQVDTFVQGEGIVFSMKSEDSDDNGVKISSFGFHVPAALSRNVDFQVYALKRNGYYADPNRDVLNQGVSYDYRGISQLGEWETISYGTIRKSDLIESDTNSKAKEPEFYKIPFDMFAATEIPSNGGVRSFYISTSLLYADPMFDGKINDEQLLVGIDDPAAPKLLIGEGTCGFSDTKFMYKARQFVGKFYYETECATEAPSLSMSPSTSPKPTSSSPPSFSPTTSDVPTMTPTPPAQPVGAEAALSFPLLKCDPKQITVPSEVHDAVREQVTQTVSNGKDAEYFYNLSSTVVEAKVRCNQRRLTRDGSQHNRLLSSQSSAIEFYLVIIGDYYSPHGKPHGLGRVVESSIYENAAAFMQELKARSASPLLLQTMEPQAKARNLDDDDLAKFYNGTFEVTIIAVPGPSPATIAPPQVCKSKAALLMAILIIIGVMGVLGLLLLFRHDERRAFESKNRKMERISEQSVSESKEAATKQEWKKENNRQMASNSCQQIKNQSEFPPREEASEGSSSSSESFGEEEDSSSDEDDSSDEDTASDSSDDSNDEPGNSGDEPTSSPDTVSPSEANQNQISSSEVLPAFLSDGIDATHRFEDRLERKLVEGNQTTAATGGLHHSGQDECDGENEEGRIIASASVNTDGPSPSATDHVEDGLKRKIADGNKTAADTVELHHSGQNDCDNDIEQGGIIAFAAVNTDSPSSSATGRVEARLKCNKLAEGNKTAAATLELHHLCQNECDSDIEQGGIIASVTSLHSISSLSSFTMMEQIEDEDVAAPRQIFADFEDESKSAGTLVSRTGSQRSARLLELSGNAPPSTGRGVFNDVAKEEIVGADTERIDKYEYRNLSMYHKVFHRIGLDGEEKKVDRAIFLTFGVCALVLLVAMILYFAC